MRDDGQLRDAFLEALLQTLCCLHSTHSPSDLQGHFQRAFPSIISAGQSKGLSQICDWSIGGRRKVEGNFAASSTPPFPHLLPSQGLLQAPEQVSPHQGTLHVSHLSEFALSLVSMCSALWSSSFAFRKKHRETEHQAQAC